MLDFPSLRYNYENSQKNSNLKKIVKIFVTKIQLKKKTKIDVELIDVSISQNG